MKPLSPGAELEVRATDPAAPKDFEAFCEATGHELVTSTRDGETYVIRLRKIS